MQKEFQEKILKVKQEWKAKMEQSQKSAVNRIMRNQSNMVNDIVAKLSGMTSMEGKEQNTAVAETSEYAPVQSGPRLVISSEKLTRHPTGSSITKIQMAVTNPQNNLNEYNVPDLNEIEKMKNQVPGHLKDWCKDFFKKMGGQDSQEGIDAVELSLVPDLVLPPKFKMHEFEKYEGKTCPSAHLTMFCRKMTGFVRDDSLLIYYFQASLTESAARWYNQLTQAKIRSWKDLANAFKEQYQYVTDMMPYRVTLENMEMKNNESFRQYVQHWRDIAAQVHPLLVKREFITMFIHTLKSPYIDHMLGVATKCFSDIVMCGEMIERALKKGQIIGGQNSLKKPFVKKNEGEVNNVNFSINKPKAGNFTTKRENNNEIITFTPIPMTYNELFQGLVKSHVVSPRYVDPLEPPFPKWYNENEACEYHTNTQGHTIEKYIAFKMLVEDLIRRKIVSFHDSEAPCVAANPLSNHQNQGVNAINEGRKVKENIEEVKTLLKWVYEQMIMR
ncbi:uncharacterized protein LOC120138397 [Hibiscus syriacus]|uniref:uncharacterized protein LOC120138397 n=1 Tax=Hibiscus syriacus TaxID=106335 RepID=UPI001922A541|nr:uncharacterized protein LOC120138397 [Hibiscus syriacus]